MDTLCSIILDLITEWMFFVVVYPVFLRENLWRDLLTITSQNMVSPLECDISGQP